MMLKNYMLYACYNYIIDIQVQSLWYCIHLYSIYSNYVWTPIMDDQRPQIPWNLEVKYSWGTGPAPGGTCGLEFGCSKMWKTPTDERNPEKSSRVLQISAQRWCFTSWPFASWFAERFLVVFPLHSVAIEHTMASWGWIASRLPATRLRSPHSPIPRCSMVLEYFPTFTP